MSKARPQLSPTKHPIPPIQTRPAPISALQAPSALAQPTLPQHLSTRPQRQLALLQLQQQVGNQAAQHFLHQTTPTTDIQRRPLVTPRQISGLMVVVLALMSRYVYVLSDEAERLERARRSRSFGARRTLDWNSLATLVGQLFVRATNRAQRIYAAMCTRGWR